MSTPRPKKDAGATPAEIVVLYKELSALVKRAGRKDIWVRTFGGRKPGVIASNSDADETLVVRSGREVLDSLRPDSLHTIWQGSDPEQLEEWYHEARGRSPEVLKKFKEHLRLDGDGFGRRLGRFVVTAQAIGLIPPDLLSATARAVLWALSMFLDPNTGEGEVSQASIAFRAGCRRKATNTALQQAIEIGILEANGPARHQRRYRLLVPSRWPKTLHEKMLDRLIEDVTAIRTAGSR